MSGRSGATVGPQPLKATVPYQLASKHRAKGKDGKSAGKAKPQRLSLGMRRTVSLDAIIGPYLQGHWPKEPEGGLCRKDKSTQTPNWSDKTSSRRDDGVNGGGGGINHKRSASWGSTEHLQEISKLKQQLQQPSKPAVSGATSETASAAPLSGAVTREPLSPEARGETSAKAHATRPVAIPLAPLSTLVPRLRCSVEGLNQELEGMFGGQPGHRQHQLLEVPDGHALPCRRRAAAADLKATRLRPRPLAVFGLALAGLLARLGGRRRPADMRKGSDLLSPPSSLSEADPSLALLNSSSPGPNKSCCFQREPPEGCEKVRVWEETSTSKQPRPVPVSFCPDPNKVNFTPHGGSSAFCPVSLLEPLLPSMDMLFCSLSVASQGATRNPLDSSAVAARADAV